MLCLYDDFFDFFEPRSRKRKSYSPFLTPVKRNRLLPESFLDSAFLEDSLLDDTRFDFSLERQKARERCKVKRLHSNDSTIWEFSLEEPEYSPEDLHVSNDTSLLHIE